ncbi:MAG: hypothetical protein K6F15_01105 [Treponema sp.]|nr:hypothetical protein [Treponema sp.]
MKKKILKLLIFTLASLVFAEVDFSGRITASSALGLPYTENDWDFIHGKISAEGEVKAYFENSYGYVNGELYSDFTKISSDTSDFLGANLKEAYFTHNWDFFSVKAGRFLETWGAADMMVVTNVLCPEDQSSISGEKVSDKKMGVDGLRFSLNWTSFSADAYWIPFFTAAKLPLDEDSVIYKSLFGSLKENGIRLGKFEEPDFAIYNGEWALRLRAFLPFCDMSLYGFYGWDDQPVQQFSVDNLLSNGNKTYYVLNGKYYRMGMMGLDSSIPIGQFVLRLEGAYYPQRAFSVDFIKQLEEANEVEFENQVVFLSGLDWIHGDWTITGQYYGDGILGSVEYLERQRYSHTATLKVGYSALGGNLSFDFSGLIDLYYLDSAFMPSVSYSISDNLTLKLLGIFYNEGWSENASYGVYRDLSCLMLKGIFTF